MFRFIIYAILFVLGYRVLKRFFAPNFGEVSHSREEEPQRGNFNEYQSFPGEKSDVVEDIDYEELD